MDAKVLRTSGSYVMLIKLLHLFGGGFLIIAAFYTLLGLPGKNEILSQGMGTLIALFMIDPLFFDSLKSQPEVPLPENLRGLAALLRSRYFAVQFILSGIILIITSFFILSDFILSDPHIKDQFLFLCIIMGVIPISSISVLCAYFPEEAEYKDEESKDKDKSIAYFSEESGYRYESKDKYDSTVYLYFLEEDKDKDEESKDNDESIFEAASECGESEPESGDSE